ncbi:MAG: helix-turn-helix domain-containing protein [Acidobacteria bacterium]|nr:helix-turn-helix domain-containing protein [Acidobacteriota bacterium]
MKNDKNSKEIFMGRMKELYTEQDAADYFGWSVFTMREIRKRGEIEHLIFSNKTVRYTLEQLEKFKNEHVNGGRDS